MTTSAVAQANDTVLLISEDGKKFYTKLSPGRRQHTHQGIIDHDDLIGQPLGRKLISSTRHEFVVVEPSLAELMIRTVRSGTRLSTSASSG